MSTDETPQDFTGRTTISAWQFSEAGGILYQSEVEIRLGGSGPAELLSHVGVLNMSTSVESVSTGKVADDLFAPPAGYALREKN